MGGTFDPIHVGHLVAANEAAFRYSLDVVLFVPAGNPWQKQHLTVTSAQHRVAMTRCAIERHPTFELSTVDVDRDGPTYAVDTLRDIRAQYPASEVFFITGADAFTRISTWKDAEHLWELAHFVAVSRPGHQLEASAAPEGTYSQVEIPALAISSTDLRERVRSCRPIRYMVPDAVRRYIEQHQLYAP